MCTGTRPLMSAWCAVEVKRSQSGNRTGRCDKGSREMEKQGMGIRKFFE